LQQRLLKVLVSQRFSQDNQKRQHIAVTVGYSDMFL